MPKKATSLLIKSIYLIIAIVAISIFLNRVFSFNALSAEESRDLELRSAAMDNLNVLAGSERCLAFKEEGSIENTPVELSLHSVVDFKKLEDFSSRFSDIEPDCARDYRFNYRVRVETIPINISSSEFETGQGGVFGQILELINGRKTTFILDSSGSMKDMAGSKSKIACLKDFMNAFIESLKPGSGVSIFIYGTGHCGIEDLSGGLVILDGNRYALKQKIDGLYPQDATPLGEALDTGFAFSKENGIDTMVLLTDGCQMDCANGDENYPVEIAEKHKDDGITVHTIGFGMLACIDQLKEISRITGGEFFDARICQELVQPKPQEQINVEIPSMVWEFGSSTFSKNDASKKIISTPMPINIYFDESKILPGKITITIVDGEMEKFSSAIEQACSTDKPSQLSMFFSYPTYAEGNNICMDFPSGKGCQRIACDTALDFTGIRNPGNYKIDILPSGNLIKVMV